MREVVETLSTESDEMSFRIAALQFRLELEEIANSYLALACPYIEQNEIVGWRPGDIMKFLEHEIDPKVFQVRRLEVSPGIPDAPNPTATDFGSLSYTFFGETPEISVATLTRHWHRMGRMLHFTAAPFDKASAVNQIGATLSFLNQSAGLFKMIQVDNQIVTIHCGEGHETMRLAARLKPEQIVECMQPQCNRCFQVQEHEGKLSLAEVALPMTCPNCGQINQLVAKEFTKLSYWEKKTFKCAHCPKENEVRCC